MTPTDAAALARYMRAHFPQQPIDEYTAEALTELLEPYPAGDCRTAVLNIADRGEQWCSPSAVKAEVKRIRSRRIERFGPVEPPPDLTDGEYRDWFIGIRTRIGDGALTREQWDEERAALGWTGARGLPELEGVFRRVPQA